jgi:hypothetical protein
MAMRIDCVRSLLATAALALAACSSPTAPASESGALVSAAPATLPTMTVHKSPTCDCCRRWVEHARQAGFPVDVENTHDLDGVKQRLGVPAPMASCHTVEVDGYMIEGHVPIEDVVRLLAERPVARGLAVPGMPLGSPGMEHPGGRVQPYVVHLVAADGSTTEFARHGQ